MKKIFYLFIAASIPVALSAKEIAPAQASDIASGFMQTLSPAVSGKSLVKAPSRHATAQENAAAPYYIFNSADGGYVIVAGDDRLGTILGYSTHGSIDPDNAPDGLAGMLSLYEKAYQAVCGEDASSSADAVTSVPEIVVQPLLGDIAWTQDIPFNLMTPTYTSGGKTVNYYTGCVACAATQIMRLYSYPAQGTGFKEYTDPVSGNTLSANFGETTYDWANMPAAVPLVPSLAQRKAYSTLAAHMGVAIEMQYEPSGSGTYDMLVPYALRTYFGYDAAVRSHNRTYYSTSEWMGIIKDELHAGRPVFYGGSSDVGSGGHAFVIDGYDSADFVHVNWGWGGNSNGYFMINHLDPSSLGIGGGAGGYNLNQDMVTGIQPAKQGSKRDYSIYGATRLSVDGPFSGAFNIMTYLENTDVEPFSGRVEAILLDRDDNIITALGGDDVSIAGFAKGYSGTTLFNPQGVKSTIANVADGDYRIRLAYKTADNSNWTILRHPKGLPAYTDVTVSRGYISIVEKHQPAPDCVITEPLTTDGDLYAGGSALVRFTVENRSADFVISNITLRLTNIDNPDVVFDATASKTIYDQSTESVELIIPVDKSVPNGKYYLTALVKDSSNEYIFDDTDAGRCVVNVLPATTAPVVRAASTMVWRSNADDAVEGIIHQGETFYGIVNLRNAGANGTANVLARLVNEATGESIPFIQTPVTFSDSRVQSVAFGRYMPVDPGKYRVELTQVAADFSEAPIASYGAPAVVDVQAADNIVAEMVTFDMPDRLTQGSRVSCSLTYRGLQSISQTLYVRIRQFTNKGGELAYMSSQKFEAGTEKSINFNYTPGRTLSDGLYMVLAETGNSQNQTPMGNYAAYGKVIAMGNVSGIDIIEASEKAVAIWVDGKQLRVVPAEDNTVASTTIYNVAGATVLCDSYDLSHLTNGIYIVEVTLSNGHRTTTKIAIR